MTRGVEHLLNVPVGHHFVFFGKISIKILCPFLSGVFAFFFFDIELHKLFIYFGYFGPLSDRSFANIFYSSVDSLFILLMVSFSEVFSVDQTDQKFMLIKNA